MLQSPAEYLILLFSIITIILFKLAITPHRPPILNVYQTPNNFFWLKVAFMYVILQLRKYKQKSNKEKQPKPEDLERPQKLSFHEKAIDAVYFNSANAQGDYFVVGTARRPNKLIDGFLFIKIASSQLGVLGSPKLPDTALYKAEDNDEYDVEGIKVTCIVPMKHWKVKYNGKMKSMDSVGTFYDVDVDLDWTSDLPIFNFDTDMDPLATAKYVATEPWSKDFFKSMQDAHQSHYEQFGKFKGTITINGTKYEVNLDSNRDHSFGHKRLWETFHRYVLHYISAENGDRFAVLKICSPVLASNISIGYVFSAKDNKCHAIRSCNLELYQHGEGGKPPVDYAFSFIAGNEHYTMQINVLDSPSFYISKDWESKVIEGLCTAEVNGTKAWGICEWEYRNVAGRHIKCN